MSGQSGSVLPVIYANSALIDLDGIADWNELTYGREHAKSYIAFLEKHIAGLGRNYARGKTVGTRPDLRYVLIRRRSHGHGHVAVYSFDKQAVNVLHVFHTAQNWQVTLSTE